MAILYTRQEGIVPAASFKGTKVTMVGAGAVNSFAALTLGKMGVKKMKVYDEDGVAEHNLSNQFFRKDDVSQFKVDALRDILGDFTDTDVYNVNRYYKNQKLMETVVVATDSMPSRQLVWEQFKKQPQAKNYIEARMGAELGLVFLIRKVNGRVPRRIEKFYESRLYFKRKTEELPCTARTIIYNVLMISSLICRAYKAILTDEKQYPTEIVFNMTTLDERSYMFMR
jgi:hypothetical protein